MSRDFYIELGMKNLITKNLVDEIENVSFMRASQKITERLRIIFYLKTGKIIMKPL